MNLKLYKVRLVLIGKEHFSSIEENILTPTIIVTENDEITDHSFYGEPSIIEDGVFVIKVNKVLLTLNNWIPLDKYIYKDKLKFIIDVLATRAGVKIVKNKKKYIAVPLTEHEKLVRMSTI